MLTKGHSGTLLKALDDAGRGLAVIATLNVKDKDNDITLKGAFGDNQVVKIVPAHNWGHVPLGKATIREDGDLVLADFQLNLDVPAAKDWHSALKFDLSEGTPIQEWSYGFTILESEMSEGSTDSRVRILKSLKVHEISPVVVGAGEGTRTVILKEAKHGGTLAQHLADVQAEVDRVIERCEEVKVLRMADGKDLSESRRADLHDVKVSLEAMGDLAEHIRKVLSPPDSNDTEVAELLLSEVIVAANQQEIFVQACFEVNLKRTKQLRTAAGLKATQRSEMK